MVNKLYIFIVIFVCGMSWVYSVAKDTPSHLEGSSTKVERSIDSSSWKKCKEPDGVEVDCQYVRVPLNWDDPNSSEKINIFVQRRVFISPPKDANTKNKRIQLWLNAGGPGQTSSHFGSIYQTLGEAAKHYGLDLEIYSMDHRGTGRSERLGCEEYEKDESDGGYKITEAEWPLCLKALVQKRGDSLKYFNSAMGAKDLKYLVDKMKKPGTEAYLYGVSYGTTLLNRFLHFYPNGAEGVVLDSLAIDTSHADYDRDYNKVGMDFLERCSQDPFCAEKLGEDPRKIVKDVFESLEKGAFSAVFSSPQLLRKGLGAMLQERDMREVIPAFLFHLKRYSESDQKAIRHLVTTFQKMSSKKKASPYDKLYSKPLLMNIDMSERWNAPVPSLKSIGENEKEMFMSLGLSVSQRKLYDLWPRYALDPKLKEPASTKVPLLILHGALDPNTPLSRTNSAKQKFDGPQQYFVTFPDTPHGVLFNTETTDPNKPPCGVQIMLSFLKNPKKKPSLECLDSIKKIQFKDSQIGKALFGTQNLWD